MSLESDVRTVLAADSQLMALLTGGVHTFGSLPKPGITRQTMPSAYDADGYLRPCAMVKQRGRVPFGDIRDLAEQVTSTSQVVEVYLFEEAAYSAIDQAAERIYTLLHGRALTGTYPGAWVYTLDRVRVAGGPLEGVSMLRQDFQYAAIRGI